MKTIFLTISILIICGCSAKKPINTLQSTDSKERSPKSYRVQEVLPGDGEVTLFHRRSDINSKTCKTNKVTVNYSLYFRVADTIASGKIKVKASSIIATENISDEISRKNPFSYTCIAVEDESIFKNDSKCEASWIEIKNCYVKR